MSIVALSLGAPEPLSPMITSVTPVTPTLDPDTSTFLSAATTDSLNLEHQSQDGDASLGSGTSQGSLSEGGPHLGVDPSRR